MANLRNRISGTHSSKIITIFSPLQHHVQSIFFTRSQKVYQSKKEYFRDKFSHVTYTFARGNSSERAGFPLHYLQPSQSGRHSIFLRYVSIFQIHVCFGSFYPPVLERKQKRKKAASNRYKIEP